MSSSPAPEAATPTAVSPTVVETWVATTAASAGPVMKISSVTIESRANAERRSSPSVITPRDWRSTLKTGSVNTPPTKTTGSSHS